MGFSYMLFGPPTSARIKKGESLYPETKTKENEHKI